MAKPNHPGIFIRQHVIPAGMSVTAAAAQLSVGRPALSNLLNGKATLSLDMAARLEKAFGADKERLLEMQATYDGATDDTRQVDAAVRPFVPPFLTIKARQIEDWADSVIESRTHLAVLLRKLVHSTADSLSKVDFPGYDNAQRKGSDGLVEAGSATPWVPAGLSYWEFGTDGNPARKAEEDYAHRLQSVDTATRASSTFVFVTPRNWPGKTTWEEEKNKLGDWKAVRALDASDLEQWLEQSVHGQIWLAEQMGLPSDGYETLGRHWQRWADASKPALSRELFASSIKAHGDSVKKWLEKPSDQPFVVAADSRDEALAFLACLFDHEVFASWRDRAAIFTSAATLRSLVSSSIASIPIIHVHDVERELAGAHRRLHCIVYRPRNAVDIEPNIALDLLTYDAFQTALLDMGVDRGEIDRLSLESGRSPTILRRRLSHRNSATRTPGWAADSDIAGSLVSTALIGAWHAGAEEDRNIVSAVANKKHDDVEHDIARLRRFDDSPVWSAGGYHGVASKIDALFAVAPSITRPDIDRFFEAARQVLSEADPALDLPEEDRWAAAIHGKKRRFSAALRDGICETLVILAVHGNGLFQTRFNLDLEGEVAKLVRVLLTPLSITRLLSHNRELPDYAEAAPDEFIKIVEHDLKQPSPVLLGLLKPVSSNAMFATPSRTGLLWALEGLAWKPQNLPRVSAILAQLCRPRIDDNWVNKPESSLQAIFRAWMPQTAASLEQRSKVLEILTRRFSDVGWKVCLEQVKPDNEFGAFSHRPRWRSDASGAGQVVDHNERIGFMRKALDLLIAWPTQTERTLGDLIECLQSVLEEDQEKIWSLAERWAQTADEPSKADLRERIRRYAFTVPSRNRKLRQQTRDRARAVYAALAPDDPVMRHAWLFADEWIQESAEELEDEDLDYAKRGERIEALRRSAIAEIWQARGFDGIRELMQRAGGAGAMGRHAAACITGFRQRLRFVEDCLALTGDVQRKAEWCVHNFLLQLQDHARDRILETAAQELSGAIKTRLLTSAPFQSSTWRLVDGLGPDIAAQYWKEVWPSWGRHTPEELTELVSRLLDTGRPRAAFNASRHDYGNIETSTLRRLLYEVATSKAERAGQSEIERYHVSEALKALDKRAGVSVEEMAQLEFLYLDVLKDSEHGIPNLEKEIAKSPMLFVQAVASAFRRSDDGVDPPEWRIEDPAQKTAAATSAYRLLRSLKAIPGVDEEGRLHAGRLTAWLAEARQLCRVYGREVIGDQCLGELLSKAPEGDDGLWPCAAVCEAMEAIASADIAEGFSIGVSNSRGVQLRGEGGAQERELAAKYRSWAERLHFDYPYVGGVLEGIAASYDREAGWQDSKTSIDKRLRH